VYSIRTMRVVTLLITLRYAKKRPLIKGLSINDFVLQLALQQRFWTSFLFYILKYAAYFFAPNNGLLYRGVHV